MFFAFASRAARGLRTATATLSYPSEKMMTASSNRFRPARMLIGSFRPLALILLAAALATAVSAQPVSIYVDVGKPAGPLHPIWSFFGHDEPNFTYMKDGK